jgi:hypothetical protein
MVNLPSRDPTPEDKRSKTKRDDTRMRITLRLNNVDSATSLRALNSSRRRGGNRPSARRVVVAPVPSAKPKVEEEESWEDVQETPLSGGRPKKLKKGTTTVKKVPKISPPEPTVVGGAPSKFPDGTDIPSEQLPWNQLTVDELARLRKRMKKNTSWTPSVTMIVRELENLGRGPNNKHKFRTQWDGLEEQIFLGPEEGGIGDPQKLVADDGIGVRENKGMRLNRAKKRKREGPNIERDLEAKRCRLNPVEQEQKRREDQKGCRGKKKEETQGTKSRAKNQIERDYSPITESAAAAESAAREKEEQKAAEKAAVAAAAAAAAAEEKERQENEERQKAAAAAAAAAEEKARAEAEAKAAEVKAAEVKAAEAEAAKEKEEKERQEKLAKETAEKAAQEKTTKPSPDKAAAKESPTKSKQEETPITKGSSKENLTSSPMKQQSGPTNVPSTLPLVESDDDLSDVPDVPALPALSDDVPSTTITTRFQRTQTKHNSTRPASHPPPPPKPEKRTRATSTLPLTPLVSRAKRKAQAASSPLPMSVPTGNKRSMSATVQKSKSSSRKTTGGSARKPGKKKRAAPTTTASAGGGGETEEDEEDLNTYCMCDEVSRGFMVACENDDVCCLYYLSVCTFKLTRAVPETVVSHHLCGTETRTGRAARVEVVLSHMYCRPAWSEVGEKKEKDIGIINSALFLFSCAFFFRYR